LQYPKCERPIEYEALLENGLPLPKAYFTFYNDVNSLGIREMSLSFGMNENEAPKIDNFTVQIRAKVDSQSEGQKKIVSKLKLTFKIIETQKFIQAEYPPIYVLVKAGESHLIPFGPLGTQGAHRLLE
jgi:hypothetical protein